MKKSIIILRLNPHSTSNQTPNLHHFFLLCSLKNIPQKKILQPIGAGFYVNLKMKIKKLTVNLCIQLLII